MARSFGLSAYLAYARKGSGAAYAAKTPRPIGTVVWAHAEEQQHVDALLALQERMQFKRPNITMLLTLSKTLDATPSAQSDGVVCEYLPEDSVINAASFFDHWKPDIGIWCGGGLSPAMLNRAHELDVPLALIDAEETTLTRPAWRWFPDMLKTLLRTFEFIMSQNEETAQYLKRTGVKERVITVTGPFVDGTTSLPYNESDREDLAQVLLGRPVWLAAYLQTSELDACLQAHRELLRMSHRAMLILVPETLESLETFQTALANCGLRYIEWSSGEVPEETTQVIFADTTDEMGLWYRVAPISFMGCSLDAGMRGSDPNEPAAHGSAILYGPNVVAYHETYDRFKEAGAARIVRDADGLGTAVKRLVPPDQAANMAHAAWDVASRGAALSDRIAEKLHDRLDKMAAA